MGRHLRALHVGDGGGRLEADLDELLRLTMLAVPSCVAVSLTVFRHARPVVAVAVGSSAGGQVRSSLSVQLPSSWDGAEQTQGPLLVMFAELPQAFPAVQAQLLAVLDLDPRRSALDEHLVLPDEVGAAALLQDQTDIDKAIGVLLGEGFLPDEGARELLRRSEEQGIELPQAARAILRGS